MKHIIHNTKNNILNCSIFEDNDDLIIGNYSCNLSKKITDIDSYIVNHIYPAMIKEEESENQTIEASPILMAMETSKEALKFELISYIKANPEITLDGFLSYCAQTFGWQEAGFVLKMMYEYVNQAVKKKMIPDLESQTKDYYFAVLKQIIVNSTDDELKERLK